MSKEIITTGAGVSSTSDSKSFRIDIAGIPIPLKRTFGALDRLIATPIEALADVLEKRLASNIASHVEAVQKERSRRGKKVKFENPSPRTTKAIGDWAAGASEVDPKEKDLSAVWRAVLDEILEGGDSSEDLLRIVKLLPNSDIRYFLQCYTRNIPDNLERRPHIWQILGRYVLLPDFKGNEAIVN